MKEVAKKIIDDHIESSRHYPPINFHVLPKEKLRKNFLRIVKSGDTILSIKKNGKVIFQDTNQRSDQINLGETS